MQFTEKYSFKQDNVGGLFYVFNLLELKSEYCETQR